MASKLFLAVKDCLRLFKNFKDDEKLSLVTLYLVHSYFKNLVWFFRHYFFGDFLESVVY